MVQMAVSPGVRGPVHGVDLGEMPPERAPGPHLYAAHGLDAAACLDEGRVARRLPSLPDLVLQLFCLLPQSFQVVIHDSGYLG